MTKLFFKLEYTVVELIIRSGELLTFEFGEPHEVKVVLQAPSAEDQAKGFLSSNAFCTVSSTYEPKQNILDIFTKIAANQIIPEDDNITPVSMEYPAANGTRVRLPALSGFPESFRTFRKDVRGELADLAFRTISALRWRTNELGPHNPISIRGFYWSIDGTLWQPMPNDYRSRVSVHGSLRVTDQQQSEVKNIVIFGKGAPLHHDLFREAWEQRYQNPRSALVIGIAAAELSIKYCISSLVPDAEWLATNLPTPPLIQMLNDYLPKLPARCKLDGQVKPPPKELLDTLRKGVTIRNQIAHAGTPNPSIDDVEIILRAVYDLLWLIDFYSGSEWALSYLRPETIAELKIK